MRAHHPLRLLLALVVTELALATVAGAPARAGGRPRIEDVEDSLAHDRSYKVRVDAALILGRLRQTHSVPALMGALHDPHPAVRASAAHALGRIGSPLARDPLAAAAEQDDSPLVRRMAREALKQLGSEGQEQQQGVGPNAPGIRARPVTKLSFEVKNVGDRSRHAGPVLRSHMRDFLVARLRPFGDVTPAEHQGMYAVDGVIKQLDMKSGASDVEVSCAVQLVVSRQPGGGVFLLTSGEATVQKPRRQFKPQLRAPMELEALEHAVRAASEDLVHHLEQQ